jgi:DNA helicase-2/ATP-dependent DNA helicase PcrA
MLSDVMRALDVTTADWTDAVAHAGGPLLVLGPAGSGKTSLVLARFLWLVERGSMPDRIVLLTPTAASADAARARLEEELTEGYCELLVTTPSQLAALICRRAGHRSEPVESTLTAGDRLAMLAERIDELQLRHHDFGGNAGALLGGFIRRIDRLKSELVGAEDYARWAAGLGESDPSGDTGADGSLEREFAEVYRAHERMLAETGGRDEGDLLRTALRLVRAQPHVRRPFEHVLVDDAQELDLGPARLARAVAGSALTTAGDPLAALRRFRGAGAERMRSFETEETRVVRLLASYRCPEPVMAAGWAVALGTGRPPATGADDSATLPAAMPAAGEIQFWRCTSDRAQAQSVAADIERLISRDGVAPGRVAVLVPVIAREGQAVSVALEERAVPHRLIGEAAFFQRAEIRDLLAWLRVLADPSDAPAAVRALARPPIELRSVDIARCTQIARRRKIDMVAALAAATESPQVPPEARERIRVFLKLYRSGAAQIDTARPDLYVHRLIERLGLRRQQLFAAQADVVERLRALARFGELASAYVTRTPQATPREFARSIAAVADYGLREQEEPELAAAGVVQVIGLEAAGGLEADHVYVLGLHAGLDAVDGLVFEPIPDALLAEALPADDAETRRTALRQRLYVAITRACTRVVLSYPSSGERGATVGPSPVVEAARSAIGGEWEERDEELFGPAETLHSTYRLLRDELLEGTMRAGGRLGELRFDTDLDVSHAVVRYLELLKVAALIARVEDDGSQAIAEALRDVNARILQAVTAEQREIFTSSGLDDYLLGAERDARRRSQVIAARDEPSLEPFLPKRGDGVVLSASDIDTYRACPLKYKFARVFRIPQEPTLHQRFGILLHQVLERYHADAADAPDGESGPPAPLAELLGLLDAGWRRGGFGDSEEERQLRGKAAAALARYYERAQSEEAQPVWFERQFTFKLGPHLLRGRVDRVDRLPNGEYELIDYKTGRPKTAAQLADDVQLSLYAVGAREAWSLEASRGAYYYLLDDVKVAVPEDDGDRSEWIRAVATEVAEGIRSQEFEPTPSVAACSICDYRLTCPAAER